MVLLVSQRLALAVFPVQSSVDSLEAQQVPVVEYFLVEWPRLVALQPEYTDTNPEDQR